MNHQLSWNFRATGGENEIGQSSRNENCYDFPDSCGTTRTSWLQTSRSLDTVASEVDYLEDVIGVLTDLQPPLAPSAQTTISTATLAGSFQTDKVQSSGTVGKPEGIVLRKCQSDATQISEELKRKQSDQRPKRTRSAEVHNLSERRRRDRINRKMRTLQELVPNCNKSDRASVLDDTIAYVKNLKHQVEVMSAVGGAIFPAPYLSEGGIQSTRVPQFSQFLPIRPKLEMGLGFGSGMISMCCAAGLPMLPVPAASMHASLAADAGLSPMSAPRNLGVPQMQMPFLGSQQLPAASIDTSAIMPNLAPGFSPSFRFSAQEESGYQINPSSNSDHQLLPTSLACCPSVSSSTMPM